MKLSAARSGRLAATERSILTQSDCTRINSTRSPATAARRALRQGCARGPRRLLGEAWRVEGRAKPMNGSRPFAASASSGKRRGGVRTERAMSHTSTSSPEAGIRGRWTRCCSIRNVIRSAPRRGSRWTSSCLREPASPTPFGLESSMLSAVSFASPSTRTATGRRNAAKFPSFQSCKRQSTIRLAAISPNLVTEFGKGFTDNGFGNWLRDRCVEAGVPGRAHGLRNAGATIAASNGASSHTLMSIFGWDTLKQAEIYTREADKIRLAEQGMHMIIPCPTFFRPVGQNREKPSNIKDEKRTWCPGAELNHRHLHFQCSAL